MQDLGHNSQMAIGASGDGKQSRSLGNFVLDGKSVISAIEPLIDAGQAARILRLHPVTVREMASRGVIPALKIGKVWRFRASSLDEWITGRIELSRHQLSPEERKER
jgi:excisionase family DNA binding protein